MRHRNRRRPRNDDSSKVKNSQQPPAHEINILMHNFSGMRSKVHQLNDLLTYTKFDIVLCVETWFDDTIDIAAICNGTNFVAIARNRPLHAGGIAAFIRKSLKPECIHLWPATIDVEAITVAIATHTIVTLMYRPPDGVIHAAKETEEICNFMCNHRRPHMILCGDLNLSKTVWERDHVEDDGASLKPVHSNARPFERNITTVTLEAGLQQINTQTNRHGKFLDVLFTSDSEMVKVAEPVEENEIVAESHHHRPCAFVLIDHISEKDTGEENTFLTSRYINHRMLDNLLRSLPTHIEETREAVEEMSASLFNAIAEATFEVKRKVTANYAKHPWLIGCATYLSLRKKLRIAKNHGIKADESRLRKEVRNIFNDRKRAYFDRVFSDSNGDRREFYKLMRFKRKCKDALPTNMQHENVAVHGPARQAAFTNHLSRAFLYEDPLLYGLDGSDNPIEKARELWQEFYSPNENWTWSRFYSADDVKYAIDKLDAKKNPGPMNVPASTFVKHRTVIAPILADLFCVRENLMDA